MFTKFLGAFFFLVFLFLFFGVTNSVSAVVWSCYCGGDQSKLTGAGSTPQNCPSRCQELYGMAQCNCNQLASLPTTPATPAAPIVSLPNPLGVSSPQALIGKVINAVLGLVGSLALLMFVFGGLTWMTSGGNAEKIKKGRDILVWAAIGLVIVFSAYGLVRVLILGLGVK